MVYILTHVAGALGIFVAIELAARLLGWMFLNKEDFGPLFPAASRLLGLTFWVAALFALAALGLLSGRGIAIIAATCCIGSLLVTRRSRGTGRSAPKRAGRDRPAIMHVALGLPTAAILAAILLLATGPTVSWDANVYHLTLPRIFLEAGGFETVPVLVYQHWPLATELLYAMAMAFSDYVAAKLVHFGFGLLVGGLLIAAVVRQTRASVGAAAAVALGWSAAALVLASDVVAFELRVAYVELAHAFVFFVAVLLVDRSTRVARPEPLFVVAGIACGLMAGIKVTGLLWTLPVALAYLLTVARSARTPRALGRFAVAFGLPALALWLPWLIKTWLATGNPAYPFLWKSFGGPWWNSDLADRFAGWQQGIGMGRGALDYLLLPLRVVLDGGPGYASFDGRLTPMWLIAVPLAGLGAWYDTLARRSLIAALAGFALWAASSQQTRFLVPILPLLALSAAIGLGWLLPRLVGVRLRPAVASALAVSVLLFAAVGHARVLRAGYGRIALYRQQPAASLFARAEPPVYAAIDLLPAAARVLMIDTNHGFFCRRPYFADSFFEASQLAAWLGEGATSANELAAKLEAAGITHVLAALRPSGVRWPQALGTLLAEATLLHQDGQHRLLALPRPALPRPAPPPRGDVDG